MKLKTFLKTVYKVYKKCGDVDIKLKDQKGNEIELESIGHFNFSKDVTMTFRKIKVVSGVPGVPACCEWCNAFNYGEIDNYGNPYCMRGIILPVKKYTCKMQDK